MVNFGTFSIALPNFLNLTAVFLFYTFLAMEKPYNHTTKWISSSFLPDRDPF